MMAQMRACRFCVLMNRSCHPYSPAGPPLAVHPMISDVVGSRFLYMLLTLFMSSAFDTGVGVKGALKK